jgi:hypothetical protein
MLPAASATTLTGDRTVAPAALPPSPKLLVAEPATVVMVYVGWPDNIPANPAIKKVLTNDLFTKVSLFDTGQNTVNTVGYSLALGKESKNLYVTVKY